MVEHQYLLSEQYPGVLLITYMHILLNQMEKYSLVYGIVVPFYFLRF